MDRKYKRQGIAYILNKGHSHKTARDYDRKKEKKQIEKEKQCSTGY